MRQGIIFAILACALWGGTIVAPWFIPEFNPILISSVRFVLYGLISLLVALPTLKQLIKKLDKADIYKLIQLSIAGNILYFACIGTAVQFAGITMTSLINGLMPVSIAFLGRGEQSSLPFSQLKLPLCIVAFGLILINFIPDVFLGVHSSTGQRIFGMACVVVAVGSWSWFAIHNARYLKESAFNSREWSSLMGIMTGLIALPAGIFTVILIPKTWFLQQSLEQWMTFAMVSVFLAIAGSWIANALWSASTRRLPISLGGQLMVFETLFACSYSYIFAGRLPSLLETIAIGCILGGVFWVIRLYMRVQTLQKAQV
ncbi:DMT family transporter [Acinetobacter brisouii]|uniref:DMT family transporter n=1 Tax=Acinetobacter brisouii TaxID=396323 RepID=UPI0012501135|nr:DMT family transporter [Acinetobacter brisouii]